MVDPSETKTKFIYNISNSGYRKELGGDYEKPGFFARFKAFLLSHLVPKTGPSSTLAFHPPTPAREQIYMHSFNESLNQYRLLLVAQGEGKLLLPNDNLDTGGLTGPAAYRLTDENLRKLAGPRRTESLYFGRVASGHSRLLRGLLEKGFATKRKIRKLWQSVLNELDRLKGHTDGRRTQRLIYTLKRIAQHSG